MDLPALNQLASYADAAGRLRGVVLAVGVVVVVAFCLAFFAFLLAPLAVLARFGVLAGVAAALIVYGGLYLVWERELGYVGVTGRQSRDGGRRKR